MFKKNEEAGSGTFDTLIGVSTILEGNITTEGTIRIDGKVKGDLQVNGDIFVGANAVITGNIFAENIHIAGTVEGNASSRGVLRLLATAKLYGDIQVNSFVADEGAIFQGKCNMVEALQEAAASAESKSAIKKPKDYKKSAVLLEDKEKAE
ncbi:MAG: polymer-forming cytoskeletal protein [Bacillota bacterium]|nr:polymer-forming cytoskeletal protein [Bacillota bacterium]